MFWDALYLSSRGEKDEEKYCRVTNHVERVDVLNLISKKKISKQIFSSNTQLLFSILNDTSNSFLYIKNI